MIRDRIHNKIACSEWTLPVCALLTVVMWWLPWEGFSTDKACGLVACALTTYIILECNNTNVLLRVRSRMVSSVWLLMICSMKWLHTFQPASIAMLCLAGGYYVFFHTYQKRQPVADMFHTYLLLGISGICLPEMMILSVLFLWHLLVFMRSFSFRSFWAAILGIGLPFLFWGTYCLWADNFMPILDWAEKITDFRPIEAENYKVLSQQQMVMWGATAFVALYTGIQYLTSSYNDKIRVRMLYYIFILQSAAIMLYAALQPHHAMNLLPLMLVSACPYIAHYITLTRTLWSSIMTMLFLALWGFVTVDTWIN